MLGRVPLLLSWLLTASICFPVAAQQLSPDHTRCENTANAFSLDAQISGCTAVLQSARETAINRALAYYTRGVVYQSKGDYARAMTDYNEAIRLNPGFANAYYNRGIAYHAKGDYDPAIADFSEAIRLSPGPAAPGYYRRGVTYEAKRDYDRAIADFRQALSIGPNIQESRDALKRLGAAP